MGAARDDHGRSNLNKICGAFGSKILLLSWRRRVHRRYKAGGGRLIDLFSKD
jgi:hypothetical protein